MVSSASLKGTFDVAVIGAGPSGTTLATFLQRQGHRCVVFDAATFPRYHIGESLIPHTYGVLDRLGILPRLRDSHFPEKHSVRFVSPSGEESEPFYFAQAIPAEHARTWQVKRSEFDEICLDNARQAGVTVQMGAKVRQVLFEGEQAVGVSVELPDQPIKEFRSRVTVDASGAATMLGNQLDLKTRPDALCKAAVWSYYRGAKRRQGIDAGETTVFTIRDRGWFWYIPLPDDIVSVGVVASPSYLFDETDDADAVYTREVSRCAPLAPFLAGAERIDVVRQIPRMAYLNRQTVGPGWVMIGDAAGFLDPIYSSGLYLALASAELAAGCVHEALVGDDLSAARLGAFCQPLWDGIDVVWRLISAFYDPKFSFAEFRSRFPQHRVALINCLVGDVVGRDMSPLLEALAQMTPPPPRLK